MILAFLVGLIVLFIRSTDEDKPLRRLFAKYAALLSVNSFLYKATVDCLECRILWLSLIGTIGMTLIYGNLFWLLGCPLVWVSSLYLYTHIFE